MTLSGGTFAKGNFSEGSTSSLGLGALILAGALIPISILEPEPSGALTFASFNPGGYTLTIDNWTGHRRGAGEQLDRPADLRVGPKRQSGQLFLHRLRVGSHGDRPR